MEILIRLLALAGLTVCLNAQAALETAPRAPLGGLTEAANLAPYWDWQTIETTHFRITFPKELLAVSRDVARFYEDAHAALAPVLHWEPSHRVQVLVVDNSDLANGFTTPFGRIGMVLFVTPPEGYFSTAYYDDWLRLLVFHEYTHYLNMDVTRSFYKATRVLFGDVLLPNTTWPTWMLEGLAVYMETRFTGAGRGRSPFYSMILRAAVEANALDTPSFLTLDKIQGPNPHYPAGETPYFFGYHLMREASLAGDRLSGLSADGGTNVENGDDALGVLSYRSGGRIPYFINGNAENVLGKDWYTLWSEWVTRSKAWGQASLETIRQEPITETKPIVGRSFSGLGAAVSPDGRWIAYTEDNEDHRMALWILDRQTGKAREAMDKIMGGKLVFSADSKRLFFSAVHRTGQYQLLSDLAMIELESCRFRWLSHGLRARDPALSPDGKQIAFTLTDDHTTGLALAPLTDDLSLGAVERLSFPARYGRIASPAFSPDGKRIAYSLHANRGAREDVWTFELATKQATNVTAAITGERRFFQFPTFSASGELHFVSDESGVFNLHRLTAAGKSERLTNLTTGLAFPSFAADGKLIASVFSLQGWNVSEVPLSAKPLSARAPIEPLDPMDVRAPAAASAQSVGSLEPADYSPWPSLLPRQWYFLPATFPGSVYLNAMASGFDAVDHHRYSVSAGYDTLVPAADGLVVYQNLSLGPVFTFSGSAQTTSTTRRGEVIGATTLLAYKREFEGTASVIFPWRFTYSELTPGFGFNIDEERMYAPALGATTTPIAKSLVVPTADAFVGYSNLETSRLAVTPEKGRSTFVGYRRYFGGGIPRNVSKGVLRDTEHFQLLPHWVLEPGVWGQIVNHRTVEVPSADATFKGRAPTLTSPFTTEDYDEVPIRGYPSKQYYGKAVAKVSLDTEFPLLRIFRGWGTNPLFFENVYGFVFGELGGIWGRRDTNQVRQLPAAGGGVRLTLDALVHVPLVLSTEFHQGFNADLGGKGEVFFQLGLGAIPL